MLFVLSGVVLSFAKGVAPNLDQRILLIGGLGTALLLVADILLIQPDASASLTWALLAVPVILILFS